LHDNFYTKLVNKLHLTIIKIYILRKNTLVNIGLILFLIFNNVKITHAFTNADSIKPLVKVNKEFLIVAHIVLDSLKNPNVTEAAINNVITQVNTVFKPIGVSFKICVFTYIQNFNYNDLVSGKVNKNELDPLYRLTHKINMYFVENPDPVACGYASLGGIAEYGNVVIGKGCISVQVISHELGHFFGLKHTFDNAIPELVNGSNCKTAGDGFCDTPADPFVLGDVASNYIDLSTCKFTSELKDANGQYYNPDVSNIMSYYGRCICLTFSVEQYNSMANYYNSHLGTW
jgi:hypothetical protein